MPDDAKPSVTQTATDTPAAGPRRIPGAVHADGTITFTPAHPAATPASSSERIPVIPGYQTLEVVGRGGMGVVFRAVQQTLNREVAIKAILNAELAGPTALARFLAEAEVVAAVRHPAVVQVFDLGDLDGRPYLVMEYLSGGSLSDRLKSSPRPAPRAAGELLERIARGVAAAHAQQIVHRDLKPSNVMFDADGRPKVTDFGIAKRTASDLTATRAQLGTPSYMAPEQATDGARHAGPAADVWALGVILYECLTGRRPFVADSIAGVLVAASTTDPIPPDRLDPAVPRDLASVCMKCLRKSPADRYPDAAALADDLARCLHGEPVHARRGEFGYRARRLARHWWKTALVALAFIAVGVGLWFAPPPSGTGGGPADPARPTGDPSPSPAVVKLRREQIELQLKAVLRKPPRPLTASTPPAEDRAALPPLRSELFRVLWEDRLVDLRGLHGDGPSFVSHDVRQSIYKDGNASHYAVDVPNRGDAVYVQVVSPNPERAHLFGIAGRPTGPKLLEIDIAHIPDDGTFDCYYQTTITNPDRSPGSQWVAISGRSLTTTVLIVFPGGRPFRSYSVVQTDTAGGNPTPYTGPLIAFAGAGNEWLYCELANDRPDVDYRVQWDW